MSSPPIVRGRPDFVNHSFGKTRLKRFPPYVFSRLSNAALVHCVAWVEAWWYEPCDGGDNLMRMDTPKYVIHAVCGQDFLAGRDHRGQPARRAQTCVLPRPDSIPCGRCQGTGPVFGPRTGRTRDGCKARLGCAIEVNP